MKKEKSNKYTIRVDEEIHDLLKELKKEYGTLENGLRKVFEYYIKGESKNGARK